MSIVTSVLSLALLANVYACSKTSKKPPAATTQAEDAAASGRPPVAVVEPETLVLRQVLLETSDTEAGWELGSQELAKKLGKILVSSGWVAARASEVSADRRARRAEAVLGLSYNVVLPTQGSPGSIAVAMEATLELVEGRGDLHPRAALIVERPLRSVKRAEVQELLRDVADRCLAGVAESLVARERLRRASHAELLSALSGDPEDPGLQAWGLQLAAERGLQEAVPAAVEALSHEDENLRATAVATLVSLKDPSSVAALSKDVDFKDYEELSVIIEAVGAIGGSDAVEFLEFVASGHPDEDLRKRAQQSIHRIEGD